ncbi:hypothetical protein PMAYCL1PPCAC_27586, partial [Pristionchus mayeri]
DFGVYWNAMKRLQDQLFTGYDNDTSPYATAFTNFTWNGNGSYAKIIMLRSRLLSMREREQSYSAHTGVVMVWEDPRLAWNPDQHSGINHMYMRRSKVWMPEIVPCESTGVDAVTLFDTSNVKIYASGQVVMLAYFFATHNCEIKSDNFPFDVNHCMMCFMIAGMHKDEMQLSGSVAPAPDLFGTGEFDYDIFLPKPVMGVFVSFDDEMMVSTVFYHFVITRQPQFWVSLIIIPTFFIGMLVLIGIFFGEDSNSLNGLVEMGLTGMMSLTVIVGILNDSIAKSKDLSALGRFVFYDIIIVVVAVVSILIAHKFRRRLVKITDRKLRMNKSHVYWQWIRRYGASTSITRYTLFVIFFVLHLINLITML